MPWCMWTTTQLHLQELEMATTSIGTAENRLRDTFSLPPIRFKIRLLTSCQYNYVFCNLIGDLKSEIGPTPCDKKWNDPQNTRPSLHTCEGSGHKTTHEAGGGHQSHSTRLTSRSQTQNEGGWSLQDIRIDCSIAVTNAWASSVLCRDIWTLANNSHVAGSLIASWKSHYEIVVVRLYMNLIMLSMQDWPATST